MTKSFVNTATHGDEKTFVRPSWSSRSCACSGTRDRGRCGRSTAILNESKPTGYTTVLKMLQIMTEKGLVERDETVRPQIYRPQYSQERTQRQLLRDFIQRAYGGSVKSLVMHALATKKSSPKDLEAIEKLLERFEGGDK